jgi:hypothetical protein
LLARHSLLLPAHACTYTSTHSRGFRICFKSHLQKWPAEAPSSFATQRTPTAAKDSRCVARTITAVLGVARCCWRKARLPTRVWDWFTDRTSTACLCCTRSPAPTTLKGLTDRPGSRRVLPCSAPSWIRSSREVHLVQIRCLPSRCDQHTAQWGKLA